MNAIGTVFKNKNLDREFINPRHGDAGWISSQDGPLEVTFCVHCQAKWVKGWKKGWVPTAEYREQAAKLRTNRIAFYSGQPDLVREKIAAKRAGKGRATLRHSWAWR